MGWSTFIVLLCREQGQDVCYTFLVCSLSRQKCLVVSPSVLLEYFRDVCKTSVEGETAEVRRVKQQLVRIAQTRTIRSSYGCHRRAMEGRRHATCCSSGFNPSTLVFYSLVLFVLQSMIWVVDRSILETGWTELVWELIHWIALKWSKCRDSMIVSA